MEKDLSIGGIVSNGIQLGLKNLVPIIVNALLFILTFWIPYLNVGTFIGMYALVTKMGKGEENLSFTEIFNPDYRKYMGEFFLCLGLIMMVFMVTAPLMGVGFVIALAWMLAPYMVIDKGLSPMDAIKKSNELTYGKKWTIFLGIIALYFAIAIGGGILLFIAGKIHALVSVIAFILVYVVGIVGMMGAYAHIYRTLTSKA